ncbi:MAG: hypothetical protein U9R48_09980 [Chloroflexota bacterium]|nr:hypothetical protein [Chloroflexota bacterium]
MNLRAKAWQAAYGTWDGVIHLLETLGLLSHSVDEVAELESTMEVALPPISPSERFRQRLRDDLSLAAQHKMSGLMIEYPRPLREAILLGLSASVLTILLIVVVVVFYTRLVTSEE